MKLLRRLRLILLIFFFSKIFFAFSQTSELEKIETEIADKPEDSTLVDILNRLSFEYYSPNPVKSKNLADKALHIAMQINYQKGVATAYRNVGNFYWTQGNYDKALENNFKSLAMFEELGDQMEIGRCYNSVALVYRDYQNYNAALDYCLKAYDIFLKENDKERIGILLNNIGGIYIRQKKFQDALSNLLKANKVFRELNDNHRLATNLNNIGFLYLQQGNFDGAFAYLTRAYKTDSAMKDRGRMAVNLNGIAEAYRIKKDYKSSLAYHNQALRVAEEIGVKEEMKNAYKGMALCFEGSLDFEKAYEYFQLYHSLYDSIFNEISSTRIKHVEALYESAKKQAEIDLLTTNRQLQDAELQKEKLIKNSLIGAFIAVAIIAFILFIGIGQKQKVNKQLQAQKAEIQFKNEDLMLKHAEITKQKDEISAHRDRIRLKTEELEIAFNEINKQKEALTQLNATKDKFFSIVAHDIKSPLDSLSAFASLLANYIDNMSKEEIRIIATNLDQSVKNTLQLTENLLTWARSQMNNLSFNPRPVKLIEIIEQKIGLFRLIAENKKIEIKTDIPEEMNLMVDENHLRFVLRNLISNALKFTMPNGTVKIKAEDLGNNILISVHDDGVGISSEVLPKIFRIDTKISTRGTAGEKGTGLGLLLCKEFVEKNGGKIRVESEVAKGSKFSFTVKKAEVLVENS